MALALAQGFCAVELLRWPRTLLFWLGIGGNLAVVLLYSLVHTNWIPFLPHHHATGAVTPDSMELAGKMAELALVPSLLVLWRTWPLTPVQVKVR